MTSIERFTDPIGAEPLSADAAAGDIQQRISFLYWDQRPSRDRVRAVSDALKEVIDAKDAVYARLARVLEWWASPTTPSEITPGSVGNCYAVAFEDCVDSGFVLRTAEESFVEFILRVDDKRQQLAKVAA